jgi:hypothetical protein
MSIRSTLRRQITEAWRESIESDYVAQRINSERSLQASLWANLNRRLPPATRRMFIEPGLSITGEQRQIRYPDLVICDTREVIGIVELKYQPRARPSWQKDLSTFGWIIENRDHVSVTNARFRGVAADARSYPLAADVLYVWAGVHAACDLDLRACIAPTLLPFFHPLHAETRHGQSAIIR